MSFQALVSEIDEIVAGLTFTAGAGGVATKSAHGVGHKDSIKKKGTGSRFLNSQHSNTPVFKLGLGGGGHLKALSTTKQPGHHGHGGGKRAKLMAVPSIVLPDNSGN